MDKAKDILLKYWGYKQFRKPQDLIIENVLTQKHTAALLPTGGGKSICYQVPGLMLEGITLVISPLISLIEDQVLTLKNRKISAVALHSQMSKSKQMIELDNIMNGKYKFVYLSPEKIANESFRMYLANLKIAQIAIDEAHCISMWGYDFRPSYLKIVELINLFPTAKVVALTASATKEVLKDILENLTITKANVFRGSFIRSNLSYSVSLEENKQFEVAELCKKYEGTGLVYTRNRKSTVEISRLLNNEGIVADYYHAGLSAEERSTKQANWTKPYQQEGAIRVLVCTNAFGMGIDKPDVRFVIHMEPPPSLEYYYQEAGRAGRNGNYSKCILLYNPLDFINFKEQIAQKFPDVLLIAKVYASLFNSYQIAVNMGEGLSFEFDFSTFIEKFKFNRNDAVGALKLLAQQGVIEMNESVVSSSTVHIIGATSALSELQKKHNPLDEIVKFILRNYGGAFNGLVHIDEAEIAKGTTIPLSMVLKVLNRLNGIKMIDYVAKKKFNKLAFLQPRIANYSPNLVMMNKLKAQYTKGIDGMVDYINDVKMCKNLKIAAYFDDKATQPCGICDNCLNIHQSKKSVGYAQVIKEIQDDLSISESKTEYINNLHKNNLPHKLLALQDLIDRGVVKVEGEKITWRKK